MHEKNVEALVKSLVTQLNTCSCPFDVLSSFEKVFDVLGLVMPPFQFFPKYRQFDFLFEWIFSLVLGHFRMSPRYPPMLYFEWCYNAMID